MSPEEAVGEGECTVGPIKAPLNVAFLPRRAVREENRDDARPRRLDEADEG